jgi:predicted NBD/HSP70 family sugar kinase
VNLPTWQEGVLDGLREVLHTPVLIENDVNLAAMAERAGGTAAGLDDFAFVWLGTGLGLASVIGGQVRKGIGGAAGEIGWMPVHGAPLPVGNEHPGKAGLQALAGGLAVQALAALHGFAGGTPADAVAAAAAEATAAEASAREASAGDLRAADARAADSTASAAGNGSPGSAGAAFLDDLAQRVSIGVAAVCVVLDPGLVVLGGPVGKAGGSALATRVAAEVSRICLARPAVAATTAADEPVLRGALQAALAQARAGLLGSLGSPSEIPA